MYEVSELIGKTLVSAKQIDSETIQFEDTEGNEYRLYHEQDCCESVNVEDIVGDLEDLVGSPILLAEEESNSDEPKRHSYGVGDDEAYFDESHTWTFYKLATVKGYVTIRFYGTSNGYYSERATFSVNGSRWKDE